MNKLICFLAAIVCSPLFVHAQKTWTIVLHKNGSTNRTNTLVAWIGNRAWVHPLQGDSILNKVSPPSEVNDLTIFIKDGQKTFWLPVSLQEHVSLYVLGIVDDPAVFKSKYTKSERKGIIKRERDLMRHTVLIDDSEVTLIKPKRPKNKLIYFYPIESALGTLGVYHFHWLN